MLSACKCAILGYLLIANFAGLVQAADANQTSIGSSHIPETVQNLGNNSSNITTIVSPGESIQAAIKASLPGNVIEVQSGTYYEKINITKRLVIRGVDVGKGLPVIDAGGEGSAINITADGVQLENFVVTNASRFGDRTGIKIASRDCIIMSNSAYNNYDGIALLNSDNNTLINNSLSNNEYGVDLSSSADNMLIGNNLGNNEYGIRLSSSTNNTAFDNNLSNNGNDISLVSSDNNTVLGNNLSNDRYAGIRLYSSNKNELSNNHILGMMSGEGIDLYSSDNNTLLSNNLSNNSNGIDLSSSDNNTLFSNNLSNNSNGIDLSSSDNNTLFSNNLSNNSNGIDLSSSDNNTLLSNNLSNNSNGISLSSSGHNRLSRNLMFGNRHNFEMDGRQISDFDNNIDATNLVNGRPLYYLRDVNNKLIEPKSNVVLLGCFNCINVTVRGLIESDNDTGILLVSTRNSRVMENHLRNLQNGIQLYFSNDNILIRNNLSNNSFGIYFASSNNNSIISNNLSNNSNGIYFTSSNNNTLARNSLSNNSYGIYFTSSNNNTIVSSNLSNNSNGIYFVSSNNNTIISNNLSKNDYGVRFSSSSHNRLSKNLAFGKGRNFNIDGVRISDFDNDIDTTNLINGRPIYYLRNANNETIDSNSNAGLVGCFNCTNITIKGLSISDTGTGIGLYKTNHSIVEYNNLTDLGDGIYLYLSNDNTIKFNTANKSNYGIRIELADNNSIENNSVSNNIRPIAYDIFRNNKFANNSEKEIPERSIFRGLSRTIFARSEPMLFMPVLADNPSTDTATSAPAPSTSSAKSSGGDDSSYGNLLQLNSPSYSQPDDADLKKLFGGIISFKPKVPMVVNETTDVAASIAPNNTQANKSLYDLKETDIGLVIRGLTISRWMSLKLEDPEEEFQIKALSTEKQEILGDIPATWRWTVRPKEEGKHPLILVATLLNSSNKEPIRDVDVHTEQIEVIANKNETVKPSPIVPIVTAGKDISSLITTVVGLLTGIFGLILLYRQLKKGKSD